MTANARILYPKWLVALITICSFFLIDQFTNQISWDIVDALAGEASPLGRSGIVAIVHYGIPMVLVPIVITAFIVGPGETLNILGLRQSAWKGLLFAFAVTLLLGIVFALIAPLSDLATLVPRFLNYALFSPFAEEVLFRCFLFGLLYRVAKWRFLPAAILGAVIFGLGHLHQGNTLADAVGVFAITLAAGLWWAWMYVQWNFNAWVPIGLHVFMNGWFNIFEVSQSAQLPIAGEITRLIVVFVSVVVTLALKRRDLI